MNERQQIADRIQRLIVKRNRELTIEATLEALLGLVFCLGVFGGVFALTWMLCFRLSFNNGLPPWQMATAVTTVFAIVSFVSAARNENVLGGLKPMTDQQRMTEMVGQLTGVGPVNPEYAVAGTALLLIAGPQNMTRAWGTWTHRIPDNSAMLVRLASALAGCQSESAIDQRTDLEACLVLRRLALIRPIERTEFTGLTLTERGRGILDKSRKN